MLNKSSHEKKWIYLPMFTSLWRLRAVIGEEFKMPDLNFDMCLASGYKETNF